MTWAWRFDLGGGDAGIGIRHGAMGLSIGVRLGLGDFGVQLLAVFLGQGMGAGAGAGQRRLIGRRSRFRVAARPSAAAMSALIVLRRLVITPLMRGPATRHSTTNRKANVTTSQKIWLGKVSVLNGGNPPGACLGASSCCGGAASAIWLRT